MARERFPNASGEGDLDQFSFIEENAIGVFGEFSLHLSDERSVPTCLYNAVTCLAMSYRLVRVN
jgi:hypothetical protein